MYAQKQRNGLKLQRDERLFNMDNASDEMTFFEACESGDITQAKVPFGGKDFDLTKLVGMKTKEKGRTCLHLAVLVGNAGLLKGLVRKLNQREFANERDNQGDTALHLAVWKYRVDLVTLLLEGEADLSVENNKRETPLCIAVKFGFLNVIKKLIEHEAEAVQKLCKEKKVLHLAVELNRVQIVEFLINKSEIIKELINQRVEGDTALHIAAKNKSEPIVDFLLKVPGVNKHALNSEGKKPLDVAREVTDYNETFRLIKKLTDYPRNLRPFMYCAPTVSQEKHKRAMEAVDKVFSERRNTELVVAALLATMTFTAVFTVPGGSYGDSNPENRGTPVFLGYYMFKLFIIFDCIAFFLSLFVCIMWQLASRLTTEEMILFMSVSGFLTCFSFGYTACGFMAAVYTIIAHKDEILAWVILGNLLLIAFCGFIAFICQSAILLVARARFHRLCGVRRLMDNGIEAVWKGAQHFRFPTIIRCLDNTSHDAVEGDEQEHLYKTSHDAVEGVEQEHGYNCSCSSSPCLRNISQSV